MRVNCSQHNVQHMKGYRTMQKTITIVTRQQVQFRRTTNRFAKKGTFSSNQGYLAVTRNTDGKFASKKA